MFPTAEFQDGESAAAAIRALRARGFESRDIEVYSAEPVELPPGVLDRPSRMSLVACICAVSLCLLAVLFVRYTQRDYPLITGGMPLFSLWATGVIFYELTMFGAIAAIVVMFFIEGGLFRRSHPAPALAEGRIYVRASCTVERAEAATECLREAGGANIR